MVMAIGLLLVVEIIFTIFTVPTGHPLEEKYDFLKKLKNNLDFPLSTQILDMLEQFEEMERRRKKQISEHVKDAYLQVAVQLTHEIVISQCNNFVALGKISDIWGMRMQRLREDAATSEARLGSDGLQEWFDKINNVALSLTIDDAELSETVKSYFEDVNAKDSLINFLYEEVCAIREEVILVSANETSRDNVMRVTSTVTANEDGVARTSSGRKRRMRSLVRSHDMDGTTETRYDNATPTPRTGRRGYQWWDPNEEQALRDGVKEFGTSNWSAILKKNNNIFKPFRTNVDLKDKWKILKKNRKPSPIRFNASG